ncbi:MAG TPA: YceI family protein [Bacteroidia bacterium]
MNAKKTIIILVSAVVANVCLAQQFYSGKETTIHFFSKTSMKNIEAKNTISKPILDVTSGAFQVRVPNKQFKFESSFMEEHFNENYMETEKYEYSTFKGKINEKVDYTKDGVNQVTCTGTMDMHGVSLPITAPGTVTVKGNQITVVSKFKLKLADYKIKVPSLYVKEIAEDMDIDITSLMEPYVKK